MSLTCKLFYIVLTIAIIFFKNGEAGARIGIEIDYYKNYGGKVASGVQCEQFSFIGDKCDPVFSLIVNYGSVSHRYKLGHYSDTHTLYKRHVGTFHVDKVPKELQFHLEVYDVDTFSGRDMMLEQSGKMVLKKKPNYGYPSHEGSLELRNLYTRVRLAASVSCDARYYSDDCSKYCYAPHFGSFCNQDGKMVCPKICKFGTCKYKYNLYCVCDKGYFGSKCDIPIHEELIDQSNNFIVNTEFTASSDAFKNSSIPNKFESTNKTASLRLKNGQRTLIILISIAGIILMILGILFLLCIRRRKNKLTINQESPLKENIVVHSNVDQTIQYQSKSGKTRPIPPPKPTFRATKTKDEDKSSAKFISTSTTNEVNSTEEISNEAENMDYAILDYEKDNVEEADSSNIYETPNNIKGTASKGSAIPSMTLTSSAHEISDGKKSNDASTSVYSEDIYETALPTEIVQYKALDLPPTFLKL